MNKQTGLTVEEYYKQAAEQGDVAAQISLGICYTINGKADPAAQCLQAAIDQGSLAAQYMSYIARAGRWLDLDTLEYFADQGYAAAQNLLGDRLVKKAEKLDNADEEARAELYLQAVKWYEKAAMQGDADAQNSLGQLYLRSSITGWCKNDVKSVINGVKCDNRAKSI